MNPKIKEDIISVLDKAIEILSDREAKDVYDLRDLSNQVIHNASVFQDENSISIAVLIYSIYKVLSRMPYLHATQYNKFILYLKSARSFFEKEDEKRYKTEIKALFKVIQSVDSKLKMYVEEVITKAKINKGSKLVAHGISVGKAADLMGISQWELMSYVGKTEIIERDAFKDDVKRRLIFARKLFK